MATDRLITLAPDDEWGPLPPHAERHHHGGWRMLERMLVVVGLVSLGYFGYVVAESYLYQRLENRELDAILASAPAPAVDVPRSPAKLALAILINRDGVVR